MSSTENKDSSSKEENNEPTTTQQEKSVPTKPEIEEPTLPAFEKSFIDEIKNELRNLQSTNVTLKSDIEKKEGEINYGKK